MPAEEPATIDTYLARARSLLARVEPEDLEREMSAGAVVVDVRDSARRASDGSIPGAIEMDYTVLEWRLAPSSDTRLDIDPDAKVIVVCNEGYSSSLAAARLQQLGVPNATDLVGGYLAWKKLAGS